MSEYKRSQVLLKINILEDGKEERLETIFGFKDITIEIDNRLIEKRNISSEKCPNFIEGVGKSSLTIEARGVFTNSLAEKQIKVLAFLKKSRKYQILFPNGDVINSKFIISKYKSNANSNDLESVEIKLNSSSFFRFIPFS